MKLIAFLIPALLVGFVVTYIVPFGTGLVARIQNPTAVAILGNRFVQVIVVGLIALTGMALVGQVGRAIGVRA